ncbi:hypothetical protein BK645_02460 [Pseudomonas protegens]|nr:hypothetical protein BK645_02460 [Pseudomonas protegens]ROM35471.1 hypothetical protein BK646_10500 [Pseudomonas protegens]
MRRFFAPDQSAAEGGAEVWACLHPLPILKEASRSKMIGSLKERDGFLVPLVLTANPLACSRNVLMDEKRDGEVVFPTPPSMDATATLFMDTGL